METSTAAAFRTRLFWLFLVLLSKWYLIPFVCTVWDTRFSNIFQQHDHNDWVYSFISILIQSRHNIWCTFTYPLFFCYPISTLMFLRHCMMSILGYNFFFVELVNRLCYHSIHLLVQYFWVTIAWIHFVESFSLKKIVFGFFFCCSWPSQLALILLAKLLQE